MFLKLISYSSLIASLFAVLVACDGGGDGGSSGGEGGPNACSAVGLTPASYTGSSSTVSPAIRNGTACNPTNSPIVFLRITMGDGSVGACSGTLITGSRIVTAAHCAAGAKTIQASANYTRQNPNYQQAAGWVIHPGYNTSTGSSLINDVAVIHMPSSIGSNTAPILASRSVAVGENVSVFGYGIINDSDDGAGTLRSGVMRVSQVANVNFNADFVSGLSMICSGDSGGAAISSSGGLTGVISGGSSGCNDSGFAIFTRIDSPEILSFLKSQAPGAAYR